MAKVESSPSLDHIKVSEILLSKERPTSQFKAENDGLAATFAPITNSVVAFSRNILLASRRCYTRYASNRRSSDNATGGFVYDRLEISGAHPIVSRTDWLNGLRGLASFLVYLSHAKTGWTPYGLRDTEKAFELKDGLFAAWYRLPFARLLLVSYDSPTDPRPDLT